MAEAELGRDLIATRSQAIEQLSDTSGRQFNGDKFPCRNSCAAMRVTLGVSSSSAKVVCELG